MANRPISKKRRGCYLDLSKEATSVQETGLVAGGSLLLRIRRCAGPTPKELAWQIRNPGIDMLRERRACLTNYTLLLALRSTVFVMNIYEDVMFWALAALQALKFQPYGKLLPTTNEPRA